ncbi:flagellar motor switch protein FliM [Geothrix oryzae]|jgi:flagellar motor switch protein FliM|uniref:Flagellar motor switch protein FliM n=1 Tax=Geothrix oryzae TaxID=2927975 RepID=A0ABM8DNN8_9BACT|nr:MULTISPECIES: flagellar motor switch protein FliM [Geothrix]BDU68548.1 flagellar motor switch protein FliM [Geothrix oryzae]
MAKILSQEEVDALLKSHTRTGPKAPAAPGPERGAPQYQAKKAQAQRKVTLYNFRRPDRVSREQMRSLHFMHDRFARNFSSSLSAYLRTITEVNLVSVEQLSYQEFLLSVPDPTCFNAISIKPLEGALALEVNPTLVFPIIDKMLGGPGEPLKQLRTMTDIEQSIFDGVLKLVLEDLREAWRGIVDLDFRIQARETSPQLIQIVAPNEVVLLVVFEVKMGPVSGMINLAIPSIILEPISTKFDQEMFTGYKKSSTFEEARLLMASLKRCPMEAAAEIRGTSLRMEEVLQLKPGDLIPLTKRFDAELDLCVDGIPRFMGLVALNPNGKRVFQVTGARSEG